MIISRTSRRHPFLVTVAVLSLALASTVFTLEPALAAPAVNASAATARASVAQAQRLHPLVHP